MSNINGYADKFLNRIKEIIRDELSDAVTIDGAIISNINNDGTVDIYIPPDKDKVFTKITNQTPF